MNRLNWLKRIFVVIGLAIITLFGSANWTIVQAKTTPSYPYNSTPYYERLDFYLTLHRQKFYNDLESNRRYFQPVLTSQDFLYRQYARQNMQLDLNDETDQVLASLVALRNSMDGYQNSIYDFNGLKSAAVLGGGEGVCEHISSAYVDLLKTVQPTLNAKTILAVTRETSFHQGFKTFLFSHQSTNQSISQPINSIATQSAQIHNQPQKLLQQPNSTPPAYLNPNLSPIEVFALNKPDHMIVSFQVELLGSSVTLFLDPTNPSFWYSDGQHLRNLQEPEIYMDYSPLGQALIDGGNYQNELNLLEETQLNHWQLLVARQYLNPAQIDARLARIQVQPRFAASVQTLAFGGFREIFLYQAQNYLAQTPHHTADSGAIAWLNQ